MRHLLAALGTVALLAAAPALAQNAQTATAHYDLLFKEGTLDDISRSDTLVYDRAVENAAKPEAARRDTGDIALSFESDETDGGDLATLTFRQGDKHRTLGQFPASVGNPMIMVFYESVVRDMAESAGGSPFYIRNRVKDALVQPAEIAEGSLTWDGAEVATQDVILRPFAGDPNSAQMQGWGDLTMTVRMSDAVPGWYHSLVAEVPGRGGAGPIYRSEMRFQELEAAQ